MMLSGFYPSLAPGVADVIRVGYGGLLLLTLVAALPHARRYFLSERWGGYAQRGLSVEIIHNPLAMPIVLVIWMSAAIALVFGRLVVPAALVNALLCHYFFIQMRWKGVLRGMGAPGFIAYWLGVAVLLVEYTRRHAPELHGVALLVLQVDFALVMLSAGMYKFSAGYRHNNGMELGMVNPEWGYWSALWGRMPPSAWWFRLFNELAWLTEVVAAVLMLVPPTRAIGGMLIVVSFVFIATQIRLGFLAEMVMVCCLLFVSPDSTVSAWVATVHLDARPPAIVPGPPVVNMMLAAGLWIYLLVLPFVRAGLAYNFHVKKAFPPWIQRPFEAYTNLFGLIIWRVFSADITNFFVRISQRDPDGKRRLISSWGQSLRFRQVAESITVTSLFTTLKYYPSNPDLFADRLLRYARTIPHGAGSVLVFEYVSVVKRDDRFDFVTIAEYEVDVRRASVSEHVSDATVSVRMPAVASPIHEGARPGSYVPLRR